MLAVVRRRFAAVALAFATSAGAVVPIPDGAARAYAMSLPACDAGYEPVARELVSLARRVAAFRPVRVFTPEACRQRFAGIAHVSTHWAQPDSHWIRDYAPVWVRDGARAVLVDLPYPAANDDGIPGRLGALLKLPVKTIDDRAVTFLGGAFEADHLARCLVTRWGKDWQNQLMADRAREWFGCRAVIALEPLPDESTRHVDMHTLLLDDGRAFVADYPDGELREVMRRNAARLAAAGIVPLPVPQPAPDDGVYLSYVNALVLGRNVLMPVYGDPTTDGPAAAAYQGAGFRVIGSPARELIRYGGALRCSTAPIHAD